MGCRILADREGDAALYCSTSMFAFGPVFTEHEGHDGDERAEAFLRWCKTTDTWSSYEALIHLDRDPRCLSESGLERAYYDWCAQEADQWKREDAALFAEDEA